MRMIAEAAGRVLRPLSSLLNTRLKLENGTASDEDKSTVTIAGSNLVVRAADSRPFTDGEREFVREVFELIRIAEQTDARMRMFEEPLEPAHPLTRVVEGPELLHRVCNLQPEGDRRAADSPGEGAADVVLLGDCDVEPLSGFGPHLW